VSTFRKALPYGGLVIAMSLLVGCGGSAATGGGDDGGDDGPIRIGVVGPMSGGAALFGQEFPRGAELAV
jgi:branched-chain amino acid transport system substrate-binding protein